MTDHAAYQRKYRHTPKGAATKKRYRATLKGVAAEERYRNSPGGRAVSRRAREAWNERNAEWRREHKRVTETVRRALATGRLVKAPCDQCGAAEVQAHHWHGYVGHELDVQWLCSTHHAAVHRGEHPR